MANSLYLICEPMYLGEERFQRWPSPANHAGPEYLTFCFAILKNRENQPPFTINFPSDLYRDIKKSQRVRDKMPDVNLADMSGDQFMDDIPWPDYHDIEIPPISEDQLESIGYHIDLLEFELLGPIKGPTISDEDFIFQKLDLNQKRTKEELFEDIPYNLFEHKFFEARFQSFGSAMRAGEGPQIPKWAHQGFDIIEEEEMALSDRQELQKALRSYDATYRANYLNPDLVPEKKLGSLKKSGTMTNWYRKGPMGRGRKPPPKPRQDVAEISQDHIWLLQQDNLAMAKDNEDTEMGGMSVGGGGNVVGAEVIGGMNATIDAPGPSDFDYEFAQISTTQGAPGPWGYESSSFGAHNAPTSGYNYHVSTSSNGVGPSGYNSGATSRVVPANTSTTVANNTPDSSIYNSGTVLSAAPISTPMASSKSEPNPPVYNFGSSARSIVNTAPGPSEYNSGTTGSNSSSSTVVPSGHTSGPGINNTTNTTASPSGHSTLSVPTPRDVISTSRSDGTNTLSDSSRPIPDYNQGYTKSLGEPVRDNYANFFPTHATSITPSINPHNTIEVQSREVSHQPNLPTAAASAPAPAPALALALASEEILQTLSTSQEPEMENLLPINKRMAARDEKDEDWQPGQKPKPKTTRKTAVSKASTANPATPKTTARKTATPRTRKPKTVVPSVAGPTATSLKAVSPTVGTPNLIKPTIVVRTRNSRAATPKTVGPKSTALKATAPRTAPRTANTRTSTPKTAASRTATTKTSTTRASSKPNTPKPSSSTSTPSLKAPVTRKSSLKKSISGESADGTWEPDEEDL
ncbi:uncharacterized protein Bfra_006078 [Botrytis fragariae]|uniref:Uncharacterized protein n=1 Tax=Botrytis fragariae TaxID=1964551 RepID=A0A8H6EI37_9HELO|nr:uncharacterized protein Bfra_006078 [Botrytis fragariae]KAF5872715.1 hypothetical protein Bfra_006078 [Botrytis fragariae]